MAKAMKQFEVLNWATSLLKNYDREANIAAMLLQHHLDIDRSTFFQTMQDVVPEKTLSTYMKDIEAHATSGVPVQHLMGYAPFYGNEFFVNEHVLIPRFETEELVEHAVQYLNTVPNKEGLIVADIGTGSGVIAITLKKLFPELRIYATDISEKALKVTQQNAHRLEADVRLMQGDFLLPLLEKEVHPAVIVSNPPYIGMSEMQSLDDTVKNFDPAIALFAENEGLSAYWTILSQAEKVSEDVLRALFFEIGANQAEAIRKMAQFVFPKSTLKVIQDLSGKDRIIVTKV